jgi:hypothetical protein
MLTIERCGSPILFANGVYTSIAAKCFDILGADFRLENVRRRSPAVECGVNDGIGCRNQSFRQRFRLCQQRPGPVTERELRICSFPR